MKENCRKFDPKHCAGHGFVDVDATYQLTKATQHLMPVSNTWSTRYECTWCNRQVSQAIEGLKNAQGAVFANGAKFIEWKNKL